MLYNIFTRLLHCVNYILHYKLQRGKKKGIQDQKQKGKKFHTLKKLLCLQP